MAELDYLSVLDALETILKADPRLRGFHVTQEFDAPTDYPWVLLDMPRVDREATFMVAGVPGGAPDVVNPVLLIRVTQCSVQGAADARRQCLTAVRAIVDVLRDNYTLGGTVSIHQVASIQFSAEAGDDPTKQTIYATALMHLKALAIA